MIELQWVELATSCFPLTSRTANYEILSEKITTFSLLSYVYCTLLGLPGILTGRRVPAGDEDLENGRNVQPPRGGRNIVISRPTTTYSKGENGGSELPPPPYQETTLKVGGGGGTAVPMGSYGGSA